MLHPRSTGHATVGEHLSPNFFAKVGTVLSGKPYPVRGVTEYWYPGVYLNLSLSRPASFFLGAGTSEPTNDIGPFQ